MKRPCTDRRSLLTHNWLTRDLVDLQVMPEIARLRGTVLDLGCGSRPYGKEISAVADCYIGMDWTNSLHGARPDFIADLSKPLPVLDQSVDWIVSFEVLEHVPEPGLMLAEAYRALRTGGALILTTPFQWWLHEAPWDFQRFTRYGLEYQLQKAGYLDVTVRETSGIWSTLILKLNYQSLRLLRGPRPLKFLVRALLLPAWWLGQTVAPRLDRIWPEARETAGFFAMGFKR